MRYTKFILMHILIDVFFVVGLVYIYLQVVQGSILIRNLPITFFVVFIIFVAIKNVKNKPIPEILGEVFLTIAMFWWYVEATKNDYDILASHYWFINFVRGLLLLLCFYFIIEIIKRYLNSFIKAAQIFYSANKEQDYTIIGSFIGATLRFKSTISIPIFNKIIRSCLGEISDILNKYSHNKDDEATENNSLEELFQNLKDSKLAKGGRWVITLYMDYVDECILVYCYQHPEKSLLRASIEAIGIFLKHGFEIIEKMSVIIIMQVLIKLLIGVFVIISIFTYKNITIKILLFGFIIIKLFEFIIQDAIIEPMMMQRILNTFLKYSNDEIDLKSIIDRFPILNKIKRLQSKDEPDDLEVPENSQNTVIKEENDSEQVEAKSHDESSIKASDAVADSEVHFETDSQFKENKEAEVNNTIM